MNQRQILGLPLDNRRLRQSPGQHDFTMGPFSNNFSGIMNRSSGYARRASSINSNDVVEDDWPDDNAWNQQPNIPFSPKIPFNPKRSGSPISRNQFNSAKRARIHQSSNNAGRQGLQTSTFLGPQQATYQNGNGNLDARTRSLTPAQQAFQRQQQQHSQVQHGSNPSQFNSGQPLYVTRNTPQIDRTRQDSQAFGQSVPMQQISYAPSMPQLISRAPQQIQNPRNFPQERNQNPARGALQHHENSMEMQQPTVRQSLAKPLRPVQSALAQPSQVKRTQLPIRQSTLEPPHPRTSLNGDRNAGLRGQGMAPVPQMTVNQNQHAGSNVRYENIALSSTPAQRPVQQIATRNRLSDYSLDVAMNGSHQAPRPVESQGFRLSKSTSRSPPNQISQRRPPSDPQAAAVLVAPVSQSFRIPTEKTDNKPQNNGLASTASNLPRRRVNRGGPFIFDDDDDDFIQPDKSKNDQSGNNTNTVATPLTPPGRTANMGADDELVTGQQATTDEQSKSASIRAQASLITPPSDPPSYTTPTTTTAPRKKIDFSKGRRGIHSLTHGLDDATSKKRTSSPQSSLESNSTGAPPSSTLKHAAEDLKAAEAEKRKQKSDERKVKKAEEKAMQDKLEKEAAALAKIKEKEEMAAKGKDADALFQEPVNEAAQARIDANNRREEQRKLEAEIKKKHKQALAEELEQTKKEAAEKAKADKEAEKALKKAKSEEERQAIRQKRELEEAKRMMEQQRKAEELLAKKKHEQEQKDAAAREKEAEAELKRQEDAEKLRKILDGSKLAATSLKSARKRQEGEKAKENENEKIANPDIDEPDLIEEDDGGLFVSDNMAIDLLEETNTATDGITRDDSEGNRRIQPTIPKSLSQNDLKTKSAAGPSSKDRGPDTPTSGKILAAESLSLRARAGWIGARKTDVESKAVGAVVQEHMERLEADQKKREDVAARERNREKAQEKKELAVLFEKLGSSMASQVQKEIKTAVEKIAKERPPTVVAKERDPLNPFMGLSSSQQKRFSAHQKYSSEIQRSQKRPVGRPPNRTMKQDKRQEQIRKRRVKEDERQAETAKKRFEDKLHKDNAEQSRPMNEEEFAEMVERQMKEWWEKRRKRQQEKAKLSPLLGESTQSQGHFESEDTDAHGSQPTTSSPATANVEKGRAGGLMARMRESNKSLGSFQAAAATKIVQNEKNYADSDSGSESEVSEEDPDEDDTGINPTLKSQPISDSPSQKNSSGIDGGKTSDESTSTQEESSDNDPDAASQQPKPRHLQDMEMIYVFSVQRSERRNQLQSEPVVIKQFLDRDDANSFAEDELRRSRWGPQTHASKITQSYSETSGLFTGEATLDSEDELFECVNVVAIAQYTGNLDGFDHRKVKPIFKPKAFFIFSSTTKLASIPEASSESDNTETTVSDEPVGNANEGSDENENENFGEDLLDDDLNALFGEAQKAFEEIDDDNQANHGQQTPPQSEAHSSHGSKFMLQEKSTPLEAYTDRELANKRASEIFLDKIKPVGGDIDRLVQFEDGVRQITECLENCNSSGESFDASNQLSDGEEIRVWVEEFLLRGPLN